MIVPRFIAGLNLHTQKSSDYCYQTLNENLYEHWNQNCSWSHYLLEGLFKSKEPLQIVAHHSFECHLSLIQYHSFLCSNLLSSEFSIDCLSYLLFYHSICLVFLLIGSYHIHLVRSCSAFDCSMLKKRYLGSWSLALAVSRWKDFTGQKFLDFLLKIYFLNFNQQTMSH